MTSIKYLVRLVFVCFFCAGFAQNSTIYSSEDVKYQSAIALYNAQQYQSAQVLFKSIESNASEDLLKSNTVK